ncbi:hypothetical protein HMI56_003049 [Coelomomyces lativittatus]|nr:hypothetical protein HMI56_003049 [Coelomomyces lativittatus]
MTPSKPTFYPPPKNIFDQLPKSAFQIPFFVWPTLGVVSLGLYYYLPRAFPPSDRTYINEQVDLVRLHLGFTPYGTEVDPMSFKAVWLDLKTWAYKTVLDVREAVESMK